jgi:hypothetical protein
MGDNSLRAPGHPKGVIQSAITSDGASLPALNGCFSRICPLDGSFSFPAGLSGQGVTDELQHRPAVGGQASGHGRGSAAVAARGLHALALNG